MTKSDKIVILGAGPTGLGAAHRLHEIGYEDVSLYEKEATAGGLAASFTDEKGFTWDIGGHVQFSHYTYFDELMDELLQDQWLHHERESWVWYRDRFVPYPFQYNVRHLPEEEKRACLRGVLQLAANPPKEKPTNFHEWILAQFGKGIADVFMFPYNYKTWAYPPSFLDCGWMGERVAPINLERFVFNILDGKDDISWGPNNTFHFPKTGGTGEIWRCLANKLPQDWLHFEKELQEIRTKEKRLVFKDGHEDSYDKLISTMPLDVLIKCSDLGDEVKKEAQKLIYSKVNVFGIGLRGKPRKDVEKKCWMYFPEDTSPYFRATVFSNYSPNNVPDISTQWSLMVEVSESPQKAVDKETIKDEVIQGLLNTRLIENKDQIIDFWKYETDHGYPTPFLGRDKVLNKLLPTLEEIEIFSRGRFGAWKYEVSNQDHSLMQGVEVVDKIIKGTEEETVLQPDFVNSRKKKANVRER